MDVILVGRGDEYWFQGRFPIFHQIAGSLPLTHIALFTFRNLPFVQTWKLLVTPRGLSTLTLSRVSLLMMKLLKQFVVHITTFSHSNFEYYTFIGRID